MKANAALRIALLGFAFAGAVCTSVQSAAAQPASAVTTDRLVIAGSPHDYWKAAALAGPAPTGAQFLLDFIRAIEAMEINDAARLQAVHAYLTDARNRRRPGGPSFEVPSPLRVSAWSKLVPQDGGSPDFAAIVRDRRIRRLLHGAAALDPETRAFLESQPALVERIFREHADAFAIFGRSLRIRGNAVDVPGGPSAVPLWERQIEQPVMRPQQFLERVLGADNGALAAFYDALMHLDAPHQRFALGSWMRDEARQRSRFAAFYGAARTARNRDPSARMPFSRGALDLFSVLSQLGVMDDGRPAAPASLPFWRSVFAAAARLEESSAAREETLDAAWFVDAVLLSANTPWEQIAAIGYAQRLLSWMPAAEQTVQFEAAFHAVLGFRRFPALVLALERTGIRDASVYALVVRRAATLGASGQPYWRRQVLAQYQGALGVVEQLRRTNRLSIASAEALLTALAAIEPIAGERYGGQIARWLDEQLRPALGNDGGDGFEPQLLAGLSGAPAEKASLRTIEWEDWTYRVDPSIVPLAMLKRIRQAQAGTSLDTVIRLWRVAATLGAAPVAGDRMQHVKAAALSLRDLQDSIIEPRPPIDGTRWDAFAVKSTLSRAVTDLAGTANAKDLGRVAEIVERLLTAVDVLAADTLISLLYAATIIDSNSPLLLQGDVAYRHDFGLLNQEGLNPELLPWWFPVERPASPWHVRGSLLGLDVGLARLRLPQVATGGPPAPPVVSGEDRLAFLASMALFNPDPVGDEVMHAMASAIRSGRARLLAAAQDRTALDATLADGGVGEWRRYYVVPSLAERPDEALAFVSLGELYWIGLSGRKPGTGADTWGASAFSLGGCLCLRLPPARAWETLSAPIGVLPTQTASPFLRVAELLSELRLPAVLARHVVPALMRDFLDHVQMLYSHDWTAVERYWAALPRERVADLVAQLTVNGPLIAGETR
jgi:hypothetical protein